MTLQQLLFHLDLWGRQIIPNQPWQLLLNINNVQRVADLELFLDSFSSFFQLLSNRCSNLRVVSELIFREPTLLKL